MEIRDIGKTVSNDITSLNTKLLKLTSWIVIALFSGEMAIQERDQLSTLKIKFLLIKDINVFRVDIPFIVDATIGNSVIRYELVFTRGFNMV